MTGDAGGGVCDESGGVCVARSAVCSIVVGSAAAVGLVIEGRRVTDLTDAVVHGRVSVIEAARSRGGGEDDGRTVHEVVDQAEVVVGRVVEFVTLDATGLPCRAGGVDRRMGERVVTTGAERVEFGRIAGQRQRGHGVTGIGP